MIDIISDFHFTGTLTREFLTYSLYSCVSVTVAIVGIVVDISVTSPDSCRDIYKMETSHSSVFPVFDGDRELDTYRHTFS